MKVVSPLYFYKGGFMWQNEDGYWIADPYPHRFNWEPSTQSGELLSELEAMDYIDNAP